MASFPSPDILIAGAGLIGVALALELRSRGATVVLLDAGRALGQASTAAAGMLAVDDPHNPAALSALSHHSLGLYPAFLERTSRLSGMPVSFQTDTTLQYNDLGEISRMAEHSLDPRQLAAALRGALPATGAGLCDDLGRVHIDEGEFGVSVQSSTTGQRFEAAALVHTSGAWAPSVMESAWIAPRKGQMLRVTLPADLPLREVHRSAEVYVVPRTVGPQAGSALIGATVEDAGFDFQTHASDLDDLRARAARLLPQLADPMAAPQAETWAGLRPATPDLLPLLGRVPGSARQWIATGHFRNGILLAPGTAEIMADLLEAKSPRVSVDQFSPERFVTAAFHAAR